VIDYIDMDKQELKFLSLILKIWIVNEESRWNNSL